MNPRGLWPLALCLCACGVADSGLSSITLLLTVAPVPVEARALQPAAARVYKEAVVPARSLQPAALGAEGAAEVDVDLRLDGDTQGGRVAVGVRVVSAAGGTVAVGAKPVQIGFSAVQQERLTLRALTDARAAEEGGPYLMALEPSPAGGIAAAELPGALLHLYGWGFHPRAQAFVGEVPVTIEEWYPALLVVRYPVERPPPPAGALPVRVCNAVTLPSAQPQCQAADPQDQRDDLFLVKP